MHTMKWGLIPSFGPIANANMSNARSETLTEKPFFRKLLNSKRCVVIQDGFYEWQKTPTTKKPFFIRFDKGANEDASDAATGSSLAMAGLYDCWHNKDTDEEVYTFTIITTDATKAFAAIHDRMPCVLPTPEAVNYWLDTKTYPFDSVAYLLKPYEGLSWYRVAPLVGNIRNNSPECMKLFNERSGIGKFFTSKREASSQVKHEPACDDADAKTLSVDCKEDLSVHEAEAEAPGEPAQPLASLSGATKPVKEEEREEAKAHVPPRLEDLVKKEEGEEARAVATISKPVARTPDSKGSRQVSASPGSRKRAASDNPGPSPKQRSIATFFKRETP
jgi:putative SOS response-associated peptidase YedK